MRLRLCNSTHNFCSSFYVIISLNLENKHDKLKNCFGIYCSNDNGLKEKKYPYKFNLGLRQSDYGFITLKTTFLIYKINCGKDETVSVHS